MSIVQSFKDTYDFSGYVIKYEWRSIYGKTYIKDSLKDSDRSIVPLIWNHQHDCPDFLGYALLENRPNGVYAYCKLFPYGDDIRAARQLIKDRGTVSLSPFIAKVQIDRDFIMYGIIREVSLVPERVDPHDDYYPVLREESED